MSTAVPALSADDVARKAMSTPMQRRVGILQAELEKLPQKPLPLVHRFTPGLYTRTITMPKDTFVISKIHKTEHPFVITKGVVEVWDEVQGAKLLIAPYIGITKPGTRRMILIKEETEWTTFHATDKTDVAEIERDIIFNPETKP